MNPATAQKLAGLAEPLRSRIAALLNTAGDQVWIISGRRSTDEQVQLRREHCGTSWSDIWTKPASQCSPPTAIPGRSLHEKGQAVDLGGNLSVAKRLAAQLGLATPVPGEPWHFEVSGDAHQSLTGIGFPDLGDILGGFGVGTAGDIAEGTADAAGIGSGWVDGFVKGLRRVALVGVLLTGGVALVVMGGIRGTQTQGAPA